MDRSYAAFDTEHEFRRLPPIPPHNINPIPLQPLRRTMNESFDSAGTEKPEIALEWSGLDYEVKTKKTTKLLVRGVSGSVRAGGMMAVLGPSGAGKSTLLDLLAGRKSPSAGSVELHTNYGIFRHDSAYVEQEDALLGVLTVAETLRFSARLAMPHVTHEEVEERVSSALRGLGLSHVADQRIGTPIARGISGGQKRRLTVGCALVMRPRVLFLDEPTSGLDSATAYEVMAAIRRVARSEGVAVIATIHSPSYETLELFEDILILAQGLTVFRGSVAQADRYVAQRGHPCPAHANLADHLLRLVSTDFMDEDLQHNRSRTITDDLEGGLMIGDVAAWAHNWRMEEVKNEASTQSHPSVSAKKSRAGGGALLHSTLVLTQRNFLNYSRNILAYGIRFGMYVGMGIMLATIWINLAQADSRINDRLSVHFFSVAFLGFMSVAGIPAFLEERSVLLRERKNGLYSAAPYVLANTIVTLPFLFACSLIFTVIVYWAIGLHPGAVFFFRFLAYLYLGILAAEFQSILIAALIPSFVASLAIAAFINGFWMSVQGYFIRNLPKFWYYWAHFIDYETFAFQLLVKSDFTNLVFPCAGAIADKSCQCSFPSSLVSQGVCAVAGEDVVQYLGFGGITSLLYAFILVIICVVYRLFFYFVIVWKT